MKNTVVLVDANVILDFLLKREPGIFSIASIGTEEVREAIEMDRIFPDLEDCIQYKCAQSVQAEYIITRNIKDFVNSEIAIRTPEEICEGLSFN